MQNERSECCNSRKPRIITMISSSRKGKGYNGNKSPVEWKLTAARGVRDLVEQTFICWYLLSCVFRKANTKRQEILGLLVALGTK